MDDPLLQALSETTDAPRESPRLLDQHTGDPRAVRELLEMLQVQGREAFALPFFDGDVTAEIAPIRTVGTAEAGGLHITANRRSPAYRAELTVDVRCDFVAASQDWRYQVSGRCRIGSDGHAEPSREFVVATAVRADGSLQMDIAQVRSEMAAAIHSIGKLDA